MLTTKLDDLLALLSVKDESAEHAKGEAKHGNMLDSNKVTFKILFLFNNNL